MRKEKLTFDESLAEYRKIIKQIGEAKTQEEISKLEYDGRRALYEVQRYAAFLGYELKDAVFDGRAKVRALVARAQEEPVEKPVEEPAAPVEKPKDTPKKSTKKTTKKSANKEK